MDECQVTPLDGRRLDLDYVETGLEHTPSHGANTVGPLRMAATRVVTERRRVAGNYDFHLLTLPQVTDGFRVEGVWPSPISLQRGWGRATARPWNDEAPDAFMRLQRGRTEFLRAASETVSGMCGSGVFSPALFPSAMGIWTRAGYEEVGQLEVMERQLGADLPEPQRSVRVDPEPDWARVLEIDRVAFEGFWRMSIHGLTEALASTDQAAVLVVEDAGRVLGYAIAGSKWGIGYLQRVAVEPEAGGRGLGRDLVRASLRWARTSGARNLVLNVRPENERAKRLYHREGLTQATTNLRILSYGQSTLLN